MSDEVVKDAEAAVSDAEHGDVAGAAEEAAQAIDHVGAVHAFIDRIYEWVKALDHKVFTPEDHAKLASETAAVLASTDPTATQ